MFAGSPSCFLFTLHPTFRVYEATGYNSNYMYLEQNAQTLPNGLVSSSAHSTSTSIVVALHLR